MRKITLANGRMIGDFLPPFIAAEIGINHNGDMDLAKEMIRAAAASGACSVKFQNYRTEDFISDPSLTHTYISQGREITESQWSMFKRCELSSTHLKELQAEANRCGVLFFTTPTSQPTIQEALDAGVLLLKNGSDYLGNLPLIRDMARTGLPTVLSTGMACLSDIEDAVAAFRDAGGSRLILLHCISSYPTPADKVNLLKIPTLAATFGVPVGFSDHTEGIAAATGAVALGACMIEKHFTLDKNLPGPDHRFSSNPAEFKQLCEAATFVAQALGKTILQPTPEEWENSRQWRLSCIANKDLPAGHAMKAEDLGFSRPGNGYAPKFLSELVGRKLKQAVVKGHILTKENFCE